MTRVPAAARAAVRLLALCALFAGISGAALRAQNKADTDIEEFEETDPYTKGDPKKLERLGYRPYGPFVWVKGELTTHVAETLGGVPVLWVETPHFKIGSSLGTYTIPLDKDERGLTDKDLKQLKKRLGQLRAPKKELDPWLRLHLYAQRLEQLYEDFCTRFDIGPADFPPGAPYLGQKEKFMVLLCGTRSSLGRFVKRYTGSDQDHSFHYGFPDGGFFFGVAAEALATGGFGLDSALYCAVTSGVLHNFINAYKANTFGSPTWFAFALAHWHSRQIDPRFTPAIGIEEGRYRQEDEWLWKPRVANLVKNDYFASMNEMFTWKEYADIDMRAHMVIWSKIDYLLEIEGGDRKGFLNALCQPKPTGKPEEVEAALVKRQVEALERCFGFTPEEFDASWARHVRRSYR